jgi:hypothetical protein
MSQPGPGTTPPKPENDRSGAEISAPAGPQPVVRCPWPSCVADNSRAQDEIEAKVHFESHQNELLQSWNGPIKCSWPNCSSRRVFKEKYLFNNHLTNIHVTPLRCYVAGCTHLEPFGKQSDLDRHVDNIHDGSRVYCSVSTCESSIIGFPRKYNLDKHMREEHDNVKCSLNHCGAVILDGEQESHIQNAHGDYECALMACVDGMPSLFTREAVRLHLISVHKVYRETAEKHVRILPSHIIRRHNGRRPLVECQDCLDFSSLAK